MEERIVECGIAVIWRTGVFEDFRQELMMKKKSDYPPDDATSALYAGGHHRNSDVAKVAEG